MRKQFAPPEAAYGQHRHSTWKRRGEGSVVGGNDSFLYRLGPGGEDLRRISRRKKPFFELLRNHIRRLDPYGKSVAVTSKRECMSIRGSARSLAAKVPPAGQLY